ncbi:argininosuccinate synthase [Chloroflexota bacterium]
MEKVVLAYSGGLDTSVAIRWIKEKYNMDVITLTINVGDEKDSAIVQQKAVNVGALKALVIDARETFVRDYLFPALQANAVYQNRYSLATALARPLMAKLLVTVAKDENASAISHGCTAKGNDQVRFDVSVAALAPHLKTIAPAREWGMTREESIAYAEKHGIPVPVTKASPYSIDENIWGRSIECGVLEDPWAEAPADAYKWTNSPENTPDEPGYIEIGFEKGIPVTLDGRQLDGVALIQELQDLAGKHGVGRVDHIEDRLVGIKSREIYEAPAATALLTAHQALESLTLSKAQLKLKHMIAGEYADLIYNGLWFTALRNDLDAFVQSTQRCVSGTVRLKLHKGNCMAIGRKSPYALYRHELATYDQGDNFDHTAATGFIHLWGLPVRTQAQFQPEE